MSSSTGRRLSLPAEETLFSDPDRPGYQPSPTSTHFEKSGAALADLAQEISEAGAEGTETRFNLHHVENSYASLLLFGFNLQSIDEDGQFELGSWEGGTVDYAIIANQPLEMQVQSTLDFLSQFLERQAVIQRTVGDESADAADVVQRTSAADSVATANTVDELRYGWRVVARMLARRATELGLRLIVNYKAAFLEDHAQWALRLPLLRRTYNEFADVRAHIDRMVAGIAAQRSRFHGGPEGVRISLQQWSTLASPEKYFAHAVRDGLFLGNGYVAFSQTEPFGAYGLRPEEWIPTGPSSVISASPLGAESREVIHFTGFEQPSTSLGLGLGELLLTFLAQRDVVQGGINDMKRFAGEIPAAAETLERYTNLEAEQEEGRRARVAELFGWWSEHLPDPPDDLYFPGHGLMR